MSEIADDMIEGFSCSHCGIYFEASHGFPVLCTGCYKEEKKRVKGHKPELPQTTNKELQ